MSILQPWENIIIDITNVIPLGIDFNVNQEISM